MYDPIADGLSRGWRTLMPARCAQTKSSTLMW